ncbi:MAG: DUF5698 domain-containing protein [Planctomycetota bacterium]
MEWYIPFLIFLARIGDVSIGTVRTMLMLQGYRLTAASLGVIEVTIWVLAVAGVVTNLTEPTAIAGYALGFGTGVYVGVWIEDKLALGYRMVRIVCTEESVHLPDHLREKGFRVTQVNGKGREAHVHIAFTVIKRKELAQLRHAVAEVAPKAFVTVERVDRHEGASFGDVRAIRRRRLLRQHVRK